MFPANYWITHLNLQPHPEGGYFKETYRSKENIPLDGLPERFSSERCFSTSIYFLLRSEDRSLFHRIKSDELWHFYAGTSLAIYVLDMDNLAIHTLGPDIEKGESLQITIPANRWFGAKVNDPNSYTLAGCTVSPGFDFRDFELADRATLAREFPVHKNIIENLTKP